MLTASAPPPHPPDPNAYTPEHGYVGWVYEGDKHVPAVIRQTAIMMGFNPGAGRGGTDTKLSRSEKVWRTKCGKLAFGFCDKLVYAELIGDSSFDENDLRGGLVHFRAALERFAVINRAILVYQKPNIVFQAGLGPANSAAIAEIYQLERIGERVTRPDHPDDELLRQYKMSGGTPWLAFIHPTGFWGYSDKDRDAIRAYAKGILASDGKGD